MRYALGLLLLSVQAFAVGTIASSCAPSGSTGGWIVTWTWTGDVSTGSVPTGATTGNAQTANCLTTNGTTSLQGFRLVSVETMPGSTAPTANYSAVVLDANSLDELGGQAAGTLSATAAQFFTAVSNPPLSGALTLNITGNSVVSATGTVTAFLVPPQMARGSGLGKLASGDIFLGNGSNVPTQVAVGGDVTMTNTGVITNTGINGTAVPVSASLLGTNSLGRIITVLGPKLLYVAAGSSDVLTNTVTTQQAFATTYSIPANLLVSGRVIEVVYTFALTTHTTVPTYDFQLYLGGTGGTLIFDSGAVAPVTGFTGRSVQFRCAIVSTAAAGSAAAIVTGCQGGTVNSTPWASLNAVTNGPFQTAATNGTLAITAAMTYGTNTTTTNTATLASMEVIQQN